MMRIGHIDGMGVVYDSEGEMILQSSERLIGRYSRVPLEVSDHWREWFVKSLFAMQGGDATCFLTDRRAVFVRRPEVFKSGEYLVTPYGAAEGISKMYRAKMILQAGGCEYCEISAEDLRFYKKHRTGISILLMDDHKEFSAFVMTKTVQGKFHDDLLSWLEGKGVTRR